jgi:hypothetical protein
MKRIDYYEKDEFFFAPPCDTCKHRHKDVDDLGCPCLKCKHYIHTTEE